MAKMIGRLARRRFTCNCCDWSRSNKQVRMAESRDWRREAELEGAAMADRIKAAVQAHSFGPALDRAVNVRPLR